MKNTRIQSRWILLGFSLAACLSLSACPIRGTDEASEFQIPPEFSHVTYEILRVQVLTKFCKECHEGFMEEKGLRPFVVAGRPDRSLLFTTVDTGTMPKNGPRLSSQYSKFISLYIDGLIAPSPTPSAAPVPLGPNYISLNQHLFQKSCFNCHGIQNPDPGRRKNLSTYQGVKENAQDILERLESIDPEEVMPPPRAQRPKPTAEVIMTFRQWIDAGFPEDIPKFGP